MGMTRAANSGELRCERADRPCVGFAWEPYCVRLSRGYAPVDLDQRELLVPLALTAR